MMIWVILMAMTAAAVMAVLWPLSRAAAVAGQADPDTQFYRDQIAEIERDRDRGMLLPEEAEAAKAEAARRLLRASGARKSGALAMGEPALRRRRAASTLALSVLPIVALAVYGAYGSPHLLSEPPGAQLRRDADKLDLGTAVAQIEAHLARQPQDGRGWEVLAPVYLRMGRSEEAVRAYESALRYLGRDAGRLANYGEALVIARDGMVTAEAQAAFQEALSLDPSSAKARLYLARAAEQDGQPEKAKAAYRDILSSSPPDAPWRGFVQEQIARIDGNQGAAAEAVRKGPDADAIAGMVQGLASRLEAQGGTPEEWTRLVRSYAVLGQRDKAAAAARRAREALAQDRAGLETIDALAQELKLTDSAP
ncbi:c-type cytochrome biogenesis protein CcmI [Microvirga thermotolerans]|uniref:C-type cytochrome biogenesis protein CcmI n=1 Tax=Microvirga thermotolerans TaxID=2651334 RepID=A0A5P9K0K0_9HYPH|nr:c-type cytochrome biogenesis protein CcmI [Microvirga thermotolerans]QFU17065.1 c-type cytochrome biogenesis protein CcmI [Microvirga thermotolerans]